MIRPVKHPWLILFVIGTLIWQSGCIILVRDVKLTESRTDVRNTIVRDPLRIHTTGGEVLLFRGGAVFRQDSLYGRGELYGLNIASEDGFSVITSYPIDQIAAMETLTESVDAGGSILLSLLGTTAALFGTAALLVAIFGSCPTIYTVDDTTAVLEAELFANSIVPLFEMRDVDRLSAKTDSAGGLQLELRNEALETHYLNHVELIEVRHDKDETAVGGEEGDVWLLKDFAEPEKAMDRNGVMWTRALADVDSLHFRSSDNTLAGINTEDFDDEIELTFAPVDADSAALVLRLRNSLLSTVLLYDYLLDAQGVNAINWMTQTLNTISGAVELGQFYRNLNLRVQVWDGSRYVEQESLGHIGPIAWEERAVPVPVMTRDSLRVRLQFAADAWRFDRVALASSMRKGPSQIWPVSRVVDANAQEDRAFLTRLSHPDTAYAVTVPGQKYTLSFDPGVSEDARTFFVAGQGYYTEWIRGSWIRDDIEGTPFVASDSTLVDAMKTWFSIRGEFEEQFFANKVPVQ